MKLKKYLVAILLCNTIVCMYWVERTCNKRQEAGWTMEVEVVEAEAISDACDKRLHLHGHATVYLRRSLNSSRRHCASRPWGTRQRAETARTSPRPCRPCAARSASVTVASSFEGHAPRLKGSSRRLNKIRRRTRTVAATRRRGAAGEGRGTTWPPRLRTRKPCNIHQLPV